MMTRLSLPQLLLLSSALLSTTAEKSEFKHLPGHTVQDYYTLPLPHTYTNIKDLPDSFNWGNVSGVSYLTHSLNQHLPQYCGSCWAHGALSSLADRIKIARKAQGDDINLSIQFVLNCGTDIAGSCHGGSHSGTFEFIHKIGYVPYDTCQPYLACSSDSNEGICPFIRNDTTCSQVNTCRTCGAFMARWFGWCGEIDKFPNATISEYGTYKNGRDENVVDKIMTEIYTRGPVTAALNAKPLHTYHGGIYRDAGESKKTTHVVSIVGWGTSENGVKYWIIRNSWGQYWGEMGFGRVELGKNVLGIESSVAWATPGSYTVQNYKCYEDGKNCGPTSETFRDPWYSSQVAAS
jgi:cathepsin X